MEEIQPEKYTNKLGVISLDKLGLLAYGNKPKGRIKSVLKPSALTNTLHRVSKDPGERSETLLHSISMIRNQDEILWAICILLSSGVMRVNEVLRIRVYDISVSGHIKIKGSKGSNDKVIHCGETSEYMARCKNKGVDPFQGITRHYVYRELKKRGVSYQSKLSSKNSVTHSFRHAAIESMRKVGIQDEEIKNISGHKRTENVGRYGNKE